MNCNRREFLGLGAAAAAGTLTGCASAIPVEEVDGSLAVFISDPHVCADPAQKRWQFTATELKKRVTEILEMRPRPANVICLGDLAFNHGEPESYALAKRILLPLQKAGIRVTHTMGNHDRRGAFLAAFPEYRGRSPVKDRVVSIVEVGNCNVVMLDSLVAKDDEYKPGAGGPVDGGFGAAQKAWLQDYLPKASRPTFVTMHHHLDGIRPDRNWLVNLMKDSPRCVGLIHGHQHNWMKMPIVNWSAGNQDTLRALCLPSAGLWGDIGLVKFRVEGNSAVATLCQKDYWFNEHLRPQERPPETWRDIIEENRGQYCRFTFGRAMRKW